MNVLLKQHISSVGLTPLTELNEKKPKTSEL